MRGLAKPAALLALAVLAAPIRLGWGGPAEAPGLAPAAAPIAAVPPAAAAPGAAAPEAVLRALKDELARSIAKLETENLGRPYFVAYSVRDSRRVDIVATFGALKAPHVSRYRGVKVDLRVGNEAFDNAHYVGKRHWDFRPVTDSLVTEDDYDALRYDLWTATDRAYKQAVEVLAQKRAYKQSRLMKEEIPDLSRDPVASSTAALTDPPFDQAAWEDRVRRLSAVFRDFPAVQSSQVSLNWTRQHTYFVDSEGRVAVKEDHDVEVDMHASALAPDGMRVADRRRVIRKVPSDLPSYEELAAEARGLAADLAALAKAPLWEETYTGPVLLEGQAVGEFFNQLLARNVSFPRSPWVEDERAREYFHSGALADRLGLRVVSSILSVTDDPGLARAEGVPLIGAYRVDDQGIPARRVALIDGGILKDLLMSRSPVKERRFSNGHGRGGSGEHPAARVSTLVVEAARTVPDSRLKRELLRQAREFGLSHGLVIRRVMDEWSREENDLLSAPLMVYKVSVKDGREELVRNASFSGVTLRALRDVLLAGTRRQAYNFYQLGPARYNREEVQASIVHPSAILVAELELKKTEKKPEKPPVLPHPYFQGR